MSELKYITRGGSSPNGKPRVFFYSHPNDFKRYFKDVSSDIFKHINCAIYYLEAQNTDFLQYDFELSQMNLIVIPVTTTLLTDNADKLQSFLSLAGKHTIPILPLMQESVMPQQFKEYFGALQYLNKNTIDETAIPYDEKMKTFLTSVLLGDELTKKIRSAFDAYVFLSYRKKDRVYAQKLMKLIHQNSFARDIAIWYDEFLTPGEDFNDMISQAIQKSSLFVLTVTPNLVNEINYIINIEYPLAVKQGLPIAPVEMVSTDSSELKRLFQGIPDSCKSSDSQALASLLMSRLSNISLNPSNDPTHVFFIGLAYLSGIDVEKDPEKGCQLITQAAEAGLDEACEKLRDMYLYGDGVAMDLTWAYHWQCTLSKKYEAIVKESARDEDVLILLKHKLQEGELAGQIGFLKECVTAYESAEKSAKILLYGSASTNPAKKFFAFAKKITGNGKHSEEGLLYLIRTYRMLMTIHSELGRVDKANEWGVKAANSALSVAKFSNDDVHSECLKISYIMFDLCLGSGNLEGAQKWLDIEKEYIGDDSDLQGKIELAMFSSQYGKLQEAVGNLDEAKECAIYALGTFIKSLKEEPSQLNLHRALMLCLYTSVLTRKMRDTSLDADFLGAGEELLSSYSNLVGEAYQEQMTSAIKAHQGRIALEEKDLDSAEKLLNESTPYFTYYLTSIPDAEMTPVFIYFMDFAADFHHAKGNFEEEENWLERLGRFVVNVSCNTKAIRDQRLAIPAYIKLFHHYTKRGYRMLAKKWYEAAAFGFYAIQISTKQPSDIEKYESFKKYATLIPKTPITTNGEIWLIDKVKQELHINSQPLDDETKKDLEKQMGELLKEFYYKHNMMENAPLYPKLGNILASGKKDAERQAVQTMCYNISEGILDAYTPYLKYDEEANLVVCYCGFTHMMYTKSSTEEWNQDMSDFHNKFFKDIPILYYPMSRINHFDLWVLLCRYMSDYVKLD